jgi:hypothetical protein
MRRRLVIAGVTVAMGFSLLTACGGDSPPSCAKNGGGSSINAQSDCLDQVSKWCEKNRPKEIAGECADKVYGYVPGGES